MVKGKVGGSRNSAAGAGSPLKWVVPALAVATFTASWAGLYPSLFVEQWYARRLFPLISCFAELIADAVSFSWLDMAGSGVRVFLARPHPRRRGKLFLGLGGAFFSDLFLLLGVSYHPEPWSLITPTDPSDS